MSTDSTIEPITVSHFQREWRRRVLNFTPSWFSVNMGTGIVSILLYNFPYQFHGLKVIAGVIFGVNVLLFFSFLGISIARYVIWPQVFKKMIFHPQQSLFLGTFPMGFGTIVNMTFYACVPAFGSEWITVAWVLWWIDSIVATIIAIGIPFVMFTRHKNDSACITAVWLQPSVSTIVSAASGAIIDSGLSDSHARLTITISYILLGIGFMPALLIMGIYFQRLTLYKIPPNALIVSTFLPIGPCGQGAFAMLRLSSVIRDLCLKSQGTTQYSAEEVRMFGAAIYACTIPIAFVIWGFGLTWLCWAISSIINVARTERIGFNMGWWGFTFPLGVFSVCTLQLGIELESEAFKVLGTIFSGTVILLWIYVASMTVLRGWTGVMFSAPCLGDCEATLLPKKEEHVEAK